jgi:hypothetical protein
VPSDRRPLPPLKGGTHIVRDHAAAILGGIVIAILLPSVLTLRTVERAVSHPVPVDNPTPYGYTVSLLLYLVPIALLGTWFFRTHPKGNFKRRALFITIAVLVPIGFALDFLFGNVFFEFRNPDATLRVNLPGLVYNPVVALWDIPIEEFVFYFSGFLAILLVYIWANEYWVPAYGVSDYADPAHHPPYIVQPRWRSALYAMLAVAAAYAFKKFGPCLEITIDGVYEPCYRDGFPLYFTFLVVAAVIPAVALYRTAGPFINWRAFSFTLLWVLLTSLLWEATLAAPFYWWHYSHKWMMNLPVHAWSNLPVEAVFLWLVVTFTTVIVFEAIKVGLHLTQPLPLLMFGPRVGGFVLRLTGTAGRHAASPSAPNGAQ